MRLPTFIQCDAPYLVKMVWKQISWGLKLLKKQTDQKKTNKQKNKQTKNKQTHKQTNKQASKQTSKQASTQASKQIKTHKT